jgi:hypothetical protein
MEDGESDGGWGRRRGPHRADGQVGTVNGSCRGHQIDHLFLLSLSLVFVQGDPYPELCAQRTVGFTLLWSATEGADQFPCEFSSFGPSYISSWDGGL